MYIQLKPRLTYRLHSLKKKIGDMKDRSWNLSHAKRAFSHLCNRSYILSEYNIMSKLELCSLSWTSLSFRLELDSLGSRVRTSRRRLSSRALHPNHNWELRIKLFFVYTIDLQTKILGENYYPDYIVNYNFIITSAGLIVTIGLALTWLLLSMKLELTWWLLMRWVVCRI